MPCGVHKNDAETQKLPTAHAATTARRTCWTVRAAEDGVAFTRFYSGQDRIGHLQKAVSVNAITRGRSIALIASSLLLARCSPRPAPNSLYVGSTDSGENRTIAEIYAVALERAKIPVARRMGIGDAARTMQALLRGDIDLYPGLIQAHTSAGVIWLAPSPANLSPCLVTSQYAAEQFWLLRMSKCAAIAPQLRLAATADFLAPNGPLQQLRRRYGGFNFKSIVRCDAGAQFDPLNRGDTDVANAVTTDPAIAETQLIVLGDDKHFWPEQHTAPAVRRDALHRHPRLAPVLDRLSPRLTIYRLQQLSRREHLLDIDPRDAAEEFVDGLDRGRRQNSGVEDKISS